MADVDIYKSKGKIGGVFKGTTIALSLGRGDTPTAGQKGALIQSINIAYAQQVSRIWELGSRDTYFIVGHTEGTAQLASIITSSEDDLLDTLSDACNVANAKLYLSGEADQCTDIADRSFQLAMSGPVVTQRSFSINTSNFVVDSAASLMFASLSR